MSRLARVLALIMLAACNEPAATGAGPSATTAAPATISSSAPTSTTTTAAPPPTEIAAQHVLIAWKGAKNAPKGVTRTKDQAKKLAEEVRQKAASGADFGDLAKQFSEDPGSKDGLGNLGKFKRDEMVEQFSTAAFALEVGGISQPVESPFGFHVIKRNQ